jgi:two-component system, OmpR family, sensor histidine kinase VicK
MIDLRTFYKGQLYIRCRAVTTVSPFPPSSPMNKSEILYGVEKAVGRGVYFMSNVKEKMDIFFDHNAPSIVVNIKEYRNGYIEIRRRGGKIRAFTEITHDNIKYCKDLIKLVDELRHLDGVKGGMAVNESEYMATTILHAAKPLTQVIYSNVKEVVAQGHYIFDTLWNAAIPAEEKIREIEGGLKPAKTTFIENRQDEIIKQIRRITQDSNQLSTCLTSGGMQYSHNYFYDIEKNLVEKQKRGEHEGIRYITNIERDNIELVKECLILGIKIRHVKNLPPMSFGVSDKEIAATIDKMEGGKTLQSLLISNESVYIKHFDFIFDELWNNGIDAEDRIRDIEQGIDSADIEIIANPKEAIKRKLNIIKSARKEILIMFSSANAMRREILIGGLRLFKEASEMHDVRVRLLIPYETDQHKLSATLQELKSYCPHVDFRGMERGFRTRITIVIVDRKECLVIELKDDRKDNSYSAAGLSTYSNSKSIVSSYVSIFESMWKQTEVYEELKVHDRMQKEFINVAAHELRTPIQPILGLSEVLLSKKGNIEEFGELLGVISRNAKRLERLTEDILDVTKIEGGSLALSKQHIRLYDVVFNIVEDYRKEAKNNMKNIKLLCNHDDGDIFVEADKERLTQIICNLLSNAIKFTNLGGKVSVNIKRHSKPRQQVIISVTDTGEGIIPEFFPRLFTKFATTSILGTGLGLYISKNIVEAHGGRIWGENNPDGKGATFSFSLPLMTC